MPPEPEEITAKNTALLEVKSVTKDFGYRTILNGIDLEMKKLGLTLLLGRNGAGKSTLLKIIAGLIRPTSGQIIFQGGDIVQNPDPLRDSLGMISHNLQFYGELSAEENLYFFGRLRKISNLKEEISLALEKTGLSQFTNASVRTFSSGMQKRLNIAKLLIFKPKILLLDEPYTGLDYDSIDFFNEYLQEYKQKSGTILLISHQLETCFNICDEIVIMEKGKVKLQQAAKDFTFKELLEKYQTT